MANLDEGRPLAIEGPFSLAATCGAVAWGRGRWPNVDWLGGRLVWVGWSGERVVWRSARQDAAGRLWIDGTASPGDDRDWAVSVLGIAEACPEFDDPVVEGCRRRLTGLRAFAAGSLYEGLVGSIVGQSISVAAAAVAEARLAALFAGGVEVAGRRFWPLPRPDQLAAADVGLVRSSGVTWRRAGALIEVARAARAGRLPSAEGVRGDPDRAREVARSLPLVGAWTAESALLWGVGIGDAYPTGDVALLRAARRAYGDSALVGRGLDRIAERWRPARGWASRLLWTELLGVAPSVPVEAGGD